ncbi:single-minded homolog 2 [Strongylocentrotus purpuratus]|uniref:PAS domain-containing protein n=1 Tax=Strongylocentrotus purpuratus TaxID=7668 RepID=A0A7M7T2D9_STRPU|nr:single-minded homolog 2 [Strongylocentrotus purpuratus]
MMLKFKLVKIDYNHKLQRLLPSLITARIDGCGYDTATLSTTSVKSAGLESLQPSSDAATIELPDGSIIKEEFPGEQPISADGSPLPTSRLEGQLETQLSLEALDGFLLVITVDGTILYATDNMSSHLGFHHVDLVHRCIYGIVHPDDHQELRVILEETLGVSHQRQSMQGAMSGAETTMPLRGAGASREISFLCRMKCFNGTNTGFVKMQCTGTMKSLPDAQRVGHAPHQVLFAAFRPFILLSADTDIESKPGTFWTTHDLDLNVASVENRYCEITGIDSSHLEGKSLYHLIHPDDLLAVYVCHKTLIDTDEVHTMFFRLMRLDGTWQWLHTRGHAVTKNGRKNSLVFAHSPVREEDIQLLRQESTSRNRYGQEDLLKMFMTTQSTDQSDQLSAGPSSSSSTSTSNMDSVPRRRWMSNDTYVVASQTGPKLKDDYSVSLHSPHGTCPSTFHQSSDNQGQDNPEHGVFSAKRKIQEDAMNEDHGFQMSVGTMPQTDIPYAMASSYYSPPQLGYGDPSLYGGFEHQPLSMYQMVAHLPPEMYDADSYRKHAMRISAEMQQEDFLIASHGGFGSQYHLPPTPQTSPPSAYPGESSYHVQYMPSEPMCGVTAPPSPPPSPIASGYQGTTSTPLTTASTTSGDCSKSGYAMDCCTGHVPSRTEYCASYIVNGAVQVKLVSGAQTGNHPYTDYESSYLPSSSAAYSRRDLYDQCDKKPFQHYQDKSVLSDWESAVRGSSDYTVGGSNPSYLQKTFLPCPLASTKSGCLAQKTFRLDDADFKSRAAALLHQGALSELPPIGSFLDFLNEELNALQS